MLVRRSCRPARYRPDIIPAVRHSFAQDHVARIAGSSIMSAVSNCRTIAARHVTRSRSGWCQFASLIMRIGISQSAFGEHPDKELASV
jgi:hypothetical protein